MKRSAANVIGLTANEYLFLTKEGVRLRHRGFVGFYPPLIRTELLDYVVGVPNVLPNSIREIYILSKAHRIVAIVPFDEEIDINLRLLSIPRVISVRSNTARLVPEKEHAFQYTKVAERMAMRPRPAGESVLEGYAKRYLEALQRRAASLAEIVGAPPSSQ